jgi:hypothetical protein
MSNGQYSDINSIPFSLRTPGSLYQGRIYVLDFTKASNEGIV